MFIVFKNVASKPLCGSFDLRNAFTTILKRTKLLSPKYPLTIEYERKRKRR